MARTVPSPKRGAVPVLEERTGLVTGPAAQAFTLQSGVLWCDTAAGLCTLTLPPAADTTVGQEFVAIMAVTGDDVVIEPGAVTDVIADGGPGASYSLNGAFARAVRLISDGDSEWAVVSTAFDNTTALAPLIGAAPTLIAQQFTEADLTEAVNGVAQELNFGQTIPARAIVLSRWLDLDAVFSGGAATAVTVQFGDGVDDNGYYDAQDVFTGAPLGQTPVPSTPGALLLDQASDIADAVRTPSVTFTPDALHNLLALDTGDLWAYVLYVATPLGSTVMP